MAGFIVIDRKIEEWRWWGCPSATALWLHLLVKANWKHGYFFGKDVERGSLITSYRHLADETGLSENTVRRYLIAFKKDGMIELKPTNKYTMITIVNYDKYQSIGEVVPSDKKTGNTQKNTVRSVQEGQVHMSVLRKESTGRDTGSGSSDPGSKGW